LIAGSIPRRYAKALLAIGVEKKNYEKLGSEVAAFARLLVEHAVLRDTLENPSHPQSKRKAIVQSLIDRLAPTPTVKSFLLLLLDRNRLPYLPAIAREYQSLADEHAGRVRADVVSAHALDSDSVARLKKSLEQKTGKQVLLEQKTDPELIAGMVTKVGSIVYDGSLRTRLEQMKDALILGHEGPVLAG